MSCPVCGSDAIASWATAHDVEYRTSDDAFEYYRCSDCGVLFIHPAPADRLAEIYPPNYYAYAGDTSIVYRVKDWLDARRFRRLLRALPGEKLAALDVGGGDGRLLGVLRRCDPRVSSTRVVDMDPGAEERARADGHEYFCGRIEDFETDERYDVVLLLNLIEHVGDPKAVLARLRELLTPTGVMLVKTPNTESLDARLFRNRDWGGYHCPRHWVLFHRESIERTARDAGLRVRSLAYTQGAPFWTVSVLAGLARRGRASITADRPAVQHRLFPVFSAAFAGFDFARGLVGAKTSQMFLELVAGER